MIAIGAIDHPTYACSDANCEAKGYLLTSKYDKIP